MYTVEKTSTTGWLVMHSGSAIAECVKESDARRIARALNLEAAMVEVREALNTALIEGRFLRQDPQDEISDALAALDRAGEV